MTVYVVLGETGEFDCYEQYVVAVYFDREMALLHAESAASQAAKFYRDQDRSGITLDVPGRVNIGAVAYKVIEAPAVRHPDEYTELNDAAKGGQNRGFRSGS